MVNSKNTARVLPSNQFRFSSSIDLFIASSYDALSSETNPELTKQYGLVKLYHVGKSNRKQQETLKISGENLN